MSKSKKPTIGKPAPPFSAPDQHGNIRTLEEFKGKKVVLYFYPEDDTPTCTVEACDLRDNYRKFLKAGYVVLGVSPDPVKKHQKFIAKYKLPFDLLSDEDLTICKAYKVWDWKTLFGRTYMGVLRTTFIIDEEGLIENIIYKVLSKKHSEQILG
jgi:thioredoxin-dependent peroxiredoxin